MQGTVTTIFGSDINTDDIIRADILQEEWEKEAFAAYAFDKADPDFRNRCKESPSNVVIAGSNFGSGSSREQAIYAIKFNNVSFVIAKKDPETGAAYPDIFYRNAVNNGFPLITLDDLTGFSLKDVLSLDLVAKTVTNITTGQIFPYEMTDEDSSSLINGGLIGLAKQDIKERLLGARKNGKQP